MNIFYLADNFEDIAKYSVDQHLGKLAIEQGQMLSTAHRVFGYDAPYKMTHKNHGSNIWIRTSRSNYVWSVNYGLALCKEHTYRHKTIHSVQYKLEWLAKNIPLEIPDIGLTRFYLAMPDYCKLNDPVLSYRNYYNQEKRHLFKWKKRSTPIWIE